MTRTMAVVTLASIFSTVPAGSAFAGDVAGTPPGAAAAAPASPTGSTDAVGASVAKLKGLADDAGSLASLRTGIQDKLGQARNWVILVMSKRPKADADEPTKAHWESDRAQAQGVADSVSGVADKFDKETLPAFLTRVQDAKKELDALKPKLTADQTTALKDAKTRTDASVAAIRKLQAANAQAATTLQAKFHTTPAPSKPK